MSRELVYTVSGSETTPARVKSVRLSGPSLAAAVLSERRAIATFAGGGGAAGNNGGVGGLVYAPDGDLLVAGAANRIFKVRPTDGVHTSFQAGPGYFSGEPTVLRLVTDPGADKAWAISSEPLMTDVGLLPTPAAGLPREVLGIDPKIRALVWAPGGGGLGPRVLYTAGDPGGGGVRHLGVIDMNTRMTTRLVSNLPAARAMVLDPFSGKLILFGGSHITQMNPAPVAPLVEFDLDLSVLRDGYGIDLVDGTADGEGRLFGLSADGRLVVVDYSRTRSVTSVGTDVRVFELEPRPAANGAGEGYLRGMAPLIGPGRRQLSYCVWDNGGFDQRDGQLSQVNPTQGNPETADDLYLPPSAIYRLDTVTAVLMTTSIIPKARLFIYEDCDGSPGRQIAQYESIQLEDKGATFNGYRLYNAVFPLGGLYVDSGRDGKVLWVSVRGVGLGVGDEEWYWATTGNRNVKGRSGRFRSAALGFADWTAVDSFGCGCSDFAFDVIGEACKVLHDNGTIDVGAMPAGSLSQIAGSADSARSADNFVTPPCGDVQEVCYLRAYIYSNCVPVKGRFELYANTCKSPVEPGQPGGPSDPLYVAAYSRVTDLGYDAVIDGHTVRAYCVEATGIEWMLPPGRDWWLAAVGDTTFALSKRTYFAYATRCDVPRMANGTPCDVHISPAMAVGQGVGNPVWRKLLPGAGARKRDLAFLVAVRQPPPRPEMMGQDDPPPVTVCPADFDGSGTVTVQDLFDFIGAWFAGCP